MPLFLNNSRLKFNRLQTIRKKYKLVISALANIQPNLYTPIIVGTVIVRAVLIRKY